MSKVTKCTINKLPMEEVRQVNPNWVEKINSRVDEYLSKAEAQLAEEAKYEDLKDFLDEDKLYKHFVDMKNNMMWFGLWEVLKYFIMHFEIKACKLMKGEWTFTENDKEMYNYFLNVRVNEKTKCKAPLLKLKSGVKINFYELIYNHKDFVIYYEFDTKDNYNVCSESYFYKFISLFSSIVNMSNNCKMLLKQGQFNLFEKHELLYSNGQLSNFIDKYNIKNIKNVSAEEIEENWKKPGVSQINVATVLNDFLEKYCMKYEEYKKLTAQLVDLEIALFDKYKQESKLYEALSYKDKDYIDETIKKSKQ